MRYLLILMLVSFSAFADHRGEIFGSYAHFILDRNNANNELYRASDGCEIRIKESNGVHSLDVSCHDTDVAVFPWAEFDDRYDLNRLPSIAAMSMSGQPCAMVTSNFDANTGTKNETEYTTNDSQSRYVAIKQSDGLYDIDYKLTCENAQ